MIFYRHFRAKVDDFVMKMELQALKLVEIVHGEREKIAVILIMLNMSAKRACCLFGYKNGELLILCVWL